MYKTLLTIFLVLSLGLSLSAQQPTFSLSSINVDQGEEFEVSMKVTNFTNLITMQYTISWDPTMLEFVEVTSGNLPYINLGPDGTFGDTTLNTDLGLLPVVWVDNTLLGVTVDNETVIFTFTMKALDTTGIAPLTFIGAPAAIEIVDVTQNPVPGTYEDGEITISGMVNNVEVNKNDHLQSLKNFPNPFTDYTHIEFELKETTNITLTLTDLSGREVYRKTQRMSEGTHQVKIDASTLPVSGEYIYKVQTTDNQLIKKLIFVK